MATIVHVWPRGCADLECLSSRTKHFGAGYKTKKPRVQQVIRVGDLASSQQKNKTPVLQHFGVITRSDDLRQALLAS